MTALTLHRSVLDTRLGFMAAELCEGTEADPRVVLLHLLAEIGAAIGPTTHCDWAGRRTPARLFVLVVGATGSGKGYAEGIARPVIEGAAPEWAGESIVSGLVSGEGLLSALGGEPTDDDEESKPIEGRSLLVIEPEFGRVLEASRREGSTLSHLLRDLWDRDDAAGLSRARPLRVRGAHLAVIGHVTPRELRHRGDIQAIENGFLNRFFPVQVRQGQARPFGPKRNREDRARHAEYVAKVVDHGRQAGHVELDHDARTRWAGIYYRLHGNRPGVVGALSARGIAHVQRLALLLALGDLSSVVTATHLHAAQELWNEAEATWRSVYGDATGDKLADRLHDAIRSAGADGLTRAELRSAAGSNNVPAERIETALRLLADAGYANARQRDTGGRPAEVWVATERAANGSNGNQPTATGGRSSHPSHSSQTHDRRTGAERRPR